MDVAILGLGRFGTQLSSELVNIGVQVLAVDNDPSRVNSIVDEVFLAAEGGHGHAGHESITGRTSHCSISRPA